LPIHFDSTERRTSARSAISGGLAAAHHRDVRPAAPDPVETAQQMDQDFLQHEVEELDARGSGPAGRGRA